jgi:hypothetical protein
MIFESRSHGGHFTVVPRADGSVQTRQQKRRLEKELKRETNWQSAITTVSRPPKRTGDM